MVGRPKSESSKRSSITLRVTQEEKKQYEEAAEKLGVSVSQYCRIAVEGEYRQWLGGQELATPSKYEEPELFEINGIKRGKVYHGDSLGLLHKTLPEESIDLIVTSPPFGLVREKSYGNVHADEYVKWFIPFAQGFKRVLKQTGNLVIDIGGAWQKGMPTRSLYHFKLLVSLVEDFGFHLCQEHYWWNPAKLPSPAEWVTVRRCRVKDAVNCIWWLSKDPCPPADNTRVAAPYGEAMKKLLKDGYDAKLRPSGHDISDRFSKDNGGAIPPNLLSIPFLAEDEAVNLLAISNTESNGRYQKHCKEKGLKPHPARFPSQLPEYFIKFLTERGDKVLDPFAGSCVTGEVCEREGRDWYCCDLDSDFLEGARGRFEADNLPLEYPPGSKERMAFTVTFTTPSFSDDSEKMENEGGRRRVPKKGNAAAKKKKK